MDLLRAIDRRASAWKNGGGTTTEIAVEPPGAGLGDFAWRVSAAEVRTPGPFSTFEGVDRTLLLVRGEALRLRVAGRGPALLTRESPPFQFPGDAPTEGEPIGGPVTDLNVMTQRGQWRSQVRYVRPAEPGATLRAAEATLILALDGALTLTTDAGSRQLVRDDAVLLRRGEAVGLDLAKAGERVVVIDLFRAR